jgi:DNA ligase-1
MMRKKPMLAYPVSDKPIDYNNTIFMQPKLDGVRCVIQYEKTGGNFMDKGKVVAYSRTGKEWKNIDHILTELHPFFAKHPNVILDGELYNHDFRDDFESIISMVRKTKPTAEDKLKSAENVQFHCYDIVDETILFVDRIKFIYDNLRDSYCVRTVESESVLDDVDAKSFHKYCLKQGYEGSILRVNDVYKCGRSWSLRKFKDFHDAEATIIDWVEGKGKRKGTIGKFMAVDADGNEFGMPVMDNFKKLQTMFKEMQSWVGKEATFTYFERTKAGSYRHPLFKAIRDYE